PATRLHLGVGHGRQRSGKSFGPKGERHALCLGPVLRFHENLGKGRSGLFLTSPSYSTRKGRSCLYIGVLSWHTVEFEWIDDRLRVKGAHHDPGSFGCNVEEQAP